MGLARPSAQAGIRPGSPAGLGSRDKIPPGAEACDFLGSSHGEFLAEETLHKDAGRELHIPDDQGRRNGCDKAAKARKVQVPDLDLDRTTILQGTHEPGFRGRRSRESIKPILRRGDGLLGKLGAEIQELVIEGQTSQMGSHYTEPYRFRVVHII